MLSRTIEDAMNDHLNKEFYSAYLYLAMSTYCDAQGWPGLAHWMEVQHDEELVHAMKFVHFIEDRDGRVRLQAIAAPPQEFGTPLEAFERVLAHEEEVSASIHALYDLATRENDHPSMPLLHWFIAEQTEEEKVARQIVDQLRLAGQDGAALLVLDRDLGARSLTAATAG